MEASELMMGMTVDTQALTSKQWSKIRTHEQIQNVGAYVGRWGMHGRPLRPPTKAQTAKQSQSRASRSDKGENDELPIRGKEQNRNTIENDN
ncbi:hypothetical protein R1flu_004612 [Riccia fluitans]|uniref:Uncharacterized protein n=1 Tax=Riccia fluitans TaxID=41844 RepID=A0ABD1YR32_9MARC